MVTDKPINLDVKIVGGSSGITLSQYGVSHFALEDVAAMRSLPNMTVTCPGDLYEAEEITKLSCSFKGPAYIRIGRTNSGSDVFIHSKRPKIKIGEPIFIIKQSGPVIVSTGSMLFFAKEVVEKLRSKNISASLVSLPTVKPLNSKKIIDLFKQILRLRYNRSTKAEIKKKIVFISSAYYVKNFNSHFSAFLLKNNLMLIADR